MKKILLLLLCWFIAFLSYGQVKIDKNWDKQLKKTDDLFKDYIDEISAAAIIVHEDTLQFVKIYGGNITDKSNFYSLGKLSKYITAIGILKLVETGEIKLHDKLSKYFGNLTFADSITIEHLLLQKSALPLLPRNINYLNNKEILEFLESSSRRGTPGEKTFHNDIDYYLLSRIIEKEYKKGYVSFLEKKIFKPIGIKNSIIIDQQYKDFDMLPNAYVVNDSNITELKPNLEIILPGANGIFLTPEDLAVFIIELNKGNIVSKQTLNNTYAKAYFDDSEIDQREDYGLFGLKRNVYNTNYFLEIGFDQFGSQANIRIPEDNINVVLLTNQPGSFLKKNTILLSNIFSNKFLFPGK
ncbi:serine hydrolase domain-containing protein [Bacteroidota bacterium]